MTGLPWDTVAIKKNKCECPKQCVVDFNLLALWARTGTTHQKSLKQTPGNSLGRQRYMESSKTKSLAHDVW